MTATGLIIDPGAGYALLTDVDGTVVHDTREEIFHILTEISGSLSRPQYTSSIGAVRTADIDLGAVDPNCTAVLGLARMDYASGGGALVQLPTGYYYGAGGTINHFSMRQNSGTYVSSIALTSFVIEDGRARYQEEISLRYQAGSNVFPAFDVTYRLYCGTFT